MYIKNLGKTGVYNEMGNWKKEGLIHTKKGLQQSSQVCLYVFNFFKLYLKPSYSKFSWKS